ncbi:ATP-binding protein [Marmoricola sp. RAF53]|uniref:sensor histidine kinase n=1 Tax=Marmoricola sp. RAF53 TaxID=3233059 RepID=UPI003F968A00
MRDQGQDSTLTERATLPRVARVCGLVVAAVSITVLVGWALGLELLTSVLPGLTTMKVNTALCLGVLAVTVLVRSRRVVRLASLLVVLVTLLVLYEIVSGTTLGIDELVFADHTAPAGIAPGQMAPATTVSLLALAVSRLLLDAGRARPAQTLLALPLLTAVMAVFGYLFGVEQLYRISTLSSVALHSAISWGLLAVAIAALVPGGLLTWVAAGTGPGSAMVRGTVPVVTAGLAATGLLRDVLVEGGVIGDRFGTAVLVVAGSLIAVTATARTARRFDASDRARVRAERSLRELNASLVEGRDAAWARAEDLAAELERERSRFERAVENTEDLVWTVETTGGAVVPAYLSPNTRPIVGGPLSADVAFPVALRDLVDPVDRALFADFETDVGIGVPADVEVRVRGLDGRVRWIWLRGAPRSDGLRTYFDGVATDTTVRRVLADQRELLLEQERLQVQRLSELARARQEFTTVAGHELRTPVAVIVGYCEILADPELAPVVRDQAIEAIGRRAAHLQVLVEGVFDLARLDAGAMHLELEPTHLGDFVASTVTDYEPVARAAGIELTHAIAGSDVFADRGRLRQVLDNLLSNGIKYTPAGGHVHVALSRHGEDAVLEVRDDGIGVAPEELPRLFDRMFRGTNAREARIPGTGLGLALTQELVEALGGEVTARANQPHGLVITITLPALARGAERAGGAGGAEGAEGDETVSEYESSLPKR